jgi:hypothetical protein
MTNGIDRMSSLASLAATHAPSAADLLRYVGLQRRRTRLTRFAQSAGWFGAGIAIGGGLALLLAPQNGAETRRRLAGQAQRARDYVASAATDSVQPSAHSA